ncbi:MAG: LuxR C-terminal-related transcriptional regulator [Chloroflexota bacterium]
MRASQIARLHQKASRWFAQEGLIDEALHHAVAAEDMAFAAQLVEQHRLTLLNQFDYHTLERWLSRLPESVIDQRPQLLLLQCWLAILTYRLTSAYVLQRTQRVEAQLENGKLALDAQERTVLRAEIAAIKSFNHGANYNFQQGIIDFRQAIVALPFSHRFMRVHIILAAALGYQAQGERAEAIRIIETELRQVETASLSLPLVWLKGYLTVIYYGAGQLRQGVQTAEAIIKQLEDQSEQWAFARGVAYRWLGTIHYEWNQLTTAERFLRKVNMSSSLTYHTGQLNLAWLYEVTGQADKANEAVDNLHRWASSLTSNQIHNSLASFQARRLCWQGKVEQAREAMRQVEIPTYVDSFMPETPPLTLAQILIAHNQESSWEEAETLVDRLWTHVAKAHNIPGQIEVLALKALLQQRQERPKKALATLERAIELAEPGGFIRAFADLGTPIATLLYQLLKQGVAPDYLGQILAAFPQTEAKQTAVSPRAEATQTQLIEPLTRREIDVLRLLGKELSNKAIAQQLSISPLTVKRHTINIYQKLSVSSRQEAVGVAQTLGILARKA